MSYQVYFLQSEEDVKEFLSYMGAIDVFFLHEGKCVHADEMHNDVMEQMSSYLHRYIIVPGGRDGIDGEITGAFTGVEYLICSKGNPLPCSYGMGRFYYRSDESNPYNTQMIKLYKKLKAHIRKNYIYHKETWIYCGPHFQKGYDEEKYTASQLGGCPLKLL